MPQDVTGGLYYILISGSSVPLSGSPCPRWILLGLFAFSAHDIFGSYLYTPNEIRMEGIETLDEAHKDIPNNARFLAYLCEHC